MFLKERCEYFPDNLLASKANVKAHKMIKEWLNDTCS
jgi:hypothetical protein